MLTRRLLRILFCLSWLLAVAGGLIAMARYEQTPGHVGETPSRWPSDCPVPLDHAHATLVMFAHPKCPCTRASVGELNRLLVQCGGSVTPHVLFFTPKNASDDWKQTDLWKSARAIPGVSVEADPAGSLAQRFGAETSGYVVVYDPQGHLIFKGGITAERGHAGDNAGESAIVSLLTNGQPASNRAPVFGCSLKGPERGGPEASCIKP